MPLHNWSGLRAGLFHHFHNAWIYRLADRLNQGLLPEGYFAAGEQISGSIEPDVVTLAEQPEFNSPGFSGGQVLAVKSTPPSTSLQQESEALTFLKRMDHLVVRRVGDERLIAVIEILSLGDRTSRTRLRQFVDKATQLLEEGVHLVVIDLFPTGSLCADGLHALLWEQWTGEQAPAAGPGDRLCVGYQSGTSVRAFAEYVRVAEPLPSVPLFLNEDWYVPLPLEETYASVWSTYPAPWQAVVIGNTTSS